VSVMTGRADGNVRSYDFWPQWNFAAFRR